MNKIAPEGQIYVCCMCGKKSKDMYGDLKIDKGWDASCMMNAVLCYEKKGENGLYIPIKIGDVNDEL